MTHRFILSLAFVIATTPAMAVGNESVLTGKTMVDGEVVTVGDLFTNAGSRASHVLAPAPALGSQLILTSADLQRVVKAFNLKWTQPLETPVVAIERNATAVQIDDIIEALRASDLTDKIATQAQFKLNNVVDAIIVNGREKPELLISNTRFNADKESFSATLQIKRDNVVLKEMVLEGLATEMVQIPVLKYPIMSNSQILPGYITEISVPKSKMRPDMVTSKNDLIGMTTRRGLQANQMLTQSDINPPVLVKRNELVTIIYKNGPIALSAKARSLGNGVKGDSLMFINTTSKKPFEAKVTGPQQAEVNLDG